ncbi:universal stress protein [Pedobacter aquatilis]|uniref:universal stress protein n=1 Tax=Pedobacter aquatilis TaxID=351343 RepID=UPI00292CB836|nr:universal stress protein [Pedobacter aquatilis]
MSTYLIPIDFSKTAIHAAKYAAKLSRTRSNFKLILLNAYYVSDYESIFSVPDMIITTDKQVADEVKERLAALQKLKEKLLEINPDAEIEVSLTRETVLRSIIDWINKEEIDLIIIGSNGKKAKDESDIGSNAIIISKASPVPVLVVPPKADYQSIRKAVLACDFKKVREVIPMQALKDILSKHAIELLVLNINSGHTVDSKEAHFLHDMLKDFSPTYHYSEHPDTIKGIVKFAKEEEAHIIIALPKNYSFFQSLLHESVSQKLTIKSHVPVLLLKD